LNQAEDGTVCEVSQATPADLDWIFRLQIKTYSPHCSIARQTLERWYGRNPEGFSVFTLNGLRIGHLTFVPLRANALESLLLGKLVENEIHEDCVHTPDEKDLIRNLYVESIILDSSNPHSQLPIKALTCLARDFVPLISRICSPTSLENLYALAASGRGERLMKGLGFKQVKSRDERRDQRALYAVSFPALEENISKLYERRKRAVNRDLPSLVPY